MSQPGAPQRFQQLDSLRAVAITVVMLHHFINPPILISGFGVTFLFVLSGYFATHTLLKLRRKVEERRSDNTGAVREFYLRRYLRICPPYFLVLLLTALWNVEGARDGLPWNTFFVANFQTLITESWNGRFSPLWSLSFLEQFYLICPFVILLCPRKRLLPVLAGAIVIAPLWRLLCAWQNYSAIEWCVNPLSSLDAVGCGALLALGRESPAEGRLMPRLLWAARWLGVPGFLLLMCAKAFHHPPPFTEVIIPTLASLSFVGLAEKASRGFGGITGAILNVPLFAKIGQMSYSIFLVHTFAELLVPRMPGVAALLETNYRAVVLIPAAIGIAYFSWNCIERPIAELRRRRGERLEVPVIGAASARLS